MHSKPVARTRTHVLRTAKASFTFVVICMIITADSHAYIDPGSGALIWQALLAVFVGASFYMRSIIRRVKQWVSPKKKDEQETEKSSV